MSILQTGISGEQQYQISRSLRFNSADSAYLNRTPASAGNRKVWTWSGWYKRSALGTTQSLFTCRIDVNNDLQIFVGSDDKLTLSSNIAGVEDARKTPTMVFRDPSSWYHIVIVFNAASTTIDFYINGTQVTAWSDNNQPGNTDAAINSTSLHRIGTSVTGTNYLNGYLTEVNFVDGQALTASSFGETDAQTGVWKPKKYTGTYGTNGFYLNFSDNSGTTSTTLGKDSSGNANNWTPNNFSVTAGAGNDSLVDTPTPYGSDTGAGGEVRGNYATLNPLIKSNFVPNLVNGNLDISGNASGWIEGHGTIGVTTGKWYWEVKPYDQFMIVGINSTAYVTGQSDPHTRTGAITWYGSTGALWVNGSATGTNLGTFNGTNTIGIALDMDAATIQFYKDNVAAGSAQSISTPIGSNAAFPCAFISGTTSTYSTFNFGQRPFAYTAPSGFKALCTTNLPTPTIGATSTTQAGKYFNTVLYTGTGSSLSVTGVGFQPDFVWLKNRAGIFDHKVHDAVRGAGQELETSSTDAESASANFTSLNSDGFTVVSGGGYNASGDTYVAWNWNAGGSNATNTSGTITSTVRANTTAGFSIVTYTGTGSNATVGHGLGVAPKMVLVKNRTSANDWNVYHSVLGGTKRLFLNTTAGEATSALPWNNTAPTSTNFSVGTSVDTNANGNSHVAYCFAEVAGYSAFGSYTGNGSTDGPFVYTGFRPAYVIVKRSDAASTATPSGWIIKTGIIDAKNPQSTSLLANTSGAEDPSGYAIDFVSNGFKVRNTNADCNANGGTYVYACFAENPFKYSLAR